MIVEESYNMLIGENVVNCIFVKITRRKTYATSHTNVCVKRYSISFYYGNLTKKREIK